MIAIASKIVLCLVLAAILGFILGYLFCKIRCKPAETTESVTVDHSADLTSFDSSARPQLLSFPDGEQDDLKMISGIGPKIEKALNDLGIFHFSQIARFNEENLAWVDHYLAFEGRAVRDDWVGQAKKLAAGEDTDFSTRYKDKH
jgi:NADH-quinone oxidoreductase subunit E